MSSCICVTARVFAQVARLLKRGGRFLFTAAGFNQQALHEAGFRVLETEDRTASVLQNATGRLRARLAYRQELEQTEGVESFDRQQTYLQAVAALSRERVLSRVMYLAECTRDAPRGHGQET
jgi:tRNA U34 5-methylaminomethyl-2-thiouridine-forming methyltransferase MnmC